MLEEIAYSLTNIVNQTQAHLMLLFSVLGILLLIHIINVSLNYRLLILGIYPRKPWGLIGIICSPFLHGNFNHLFFNAIPLFVLMDFMLIYSQKTWAIATISIMFISGLLTWIFGRKAIHVGASAVITGYWSYLVFNIYQQTSVTSIILGVICLYYFAGIFFGIIPNKKGVSWEGHLFGFIGGIITAWAMSIPAFYSFFSNLL